MFTGLTLAQLFTKIIPLAKVFVESAWGAGSSDAGGMSYDDDNDVIDEGKGLPESLLSDIQEISDRFEPRQRPHVSFNKVMGILYVTMRLNPKVYLPNRMFANAWGIDFDLPIHIELKFSAEVRAVYRL